MSNNKARYYRNTQKGTIVENMGKEAEVIDPGSAELARGTRIAISYINKSSQWVPWESNKPSSRYEKNSNRGSAKKKLKEVLKDITFRDWEFLINDKWDHVTLQAKLNSCMRNSTKLVKPVCGREWPIYHYMSKSEIVKTIYSAISQAEIHERMKDFKYKGTRPFSPYFDVEDIGKTEEKEIPEDIDF